MADKFPPARRAACSLAFRSQAAVPPGAESFWAGRSRAPVSGSGGCCAWWHLGAGAGRGKESELRIQLWPEAGRGVRLGEDRSREGRPREARHPQACRSCGSPGVARVRARSWCAQCQQTETIRLWQRPLKGLCLLPARPFPVHWRPTPPGRPLRSAVPVRPRPGSSTLEVPTRSVGSGQRAEACRAGSCRQKQVLGRS